MHPKAGPHILMERITRNETTQPRLQSVTGLRETRRQLGSQSLAAKAGVFQAVAV